MEYKILKYDLASQKQTINCYEQIKYQLLINCERMGKVQMFIRDQKHSKKYLKRIAKKGSKASENQSYLQLGRNIKKLP